MIPLGTVSIDSSLSGILQRKVIVHVTFIKVGEINTLKECFDADVLLRCKWREPELDDYKVSEFNLFCNLSYIEAYVYYVKYLILHSPYISRYRYCLKIAEIATIKLPNGALCPYKDSNCSS